jgi:CBS domain-containing protein/ribosome-associated translation inhibitor RaiA
MKEDPTTMFRKIGKKTISDFIESANIINSNASISKVLGILIKMNNYNVYYKNGNKITAINLTDILSARDFNAQKLNSIAKITPTIAEDSNIEEAASIMSHYRLRSIPVIEDGEIIGQISTKSIVKSMEDTDIKIPSTKIMTGNLISIHETDPISTAKNIMIRHRIDHIPIIEDNLKGIVTSFDIAKIILTSDNIDNTSYGRPKSKRPLDLPAKGIAERNVTISSINDSVAKVIQLMNSTNSTYSIVTLGDEIQGIITHRDIISLLGQKIEEDVPVYIIGLPDDSFSSELAKTKFNTLIKFLKKTLPDLEEARCRIKLISVRGKTKRYEVDVRIFTTTNKYNYTNGGLDLVTIFDQLRDSLKRKLSKKSQKRQKQSTRYNI